MDVQCAMSEMCLCLCNKRTRNISVSRSKVVNMCIAPCHSHSNKQKYAQSINESANNRLKRENGSEESIKSNWNKVFLQWIKCVVWIHAQHISTYCLYTMQCEKNNSPIQRKLDGDENEGTSLKKPWKSSKMNTLLCFSIHFNNRISLPLLQIKIGKFWVFTGCQTSKFSNLDNFCTALLCSLVESLHASVTASIFKIKFH